MRPHPLQSARAFATALPLLLAACQGVAGLPAATGSATEAPPVAVERAARSGSGATDIVYDASQMAELPCHSMDFTIMGRCSDAEVQLVAVEIQRREAAQAPIGIIEASKLMDADTGASDVEDGAAVEDGTPTAADDATPAAADASGESGEGGAASG